MVEHGIREAGRQSQEHTRRAFVDDGVYFFERNANCQIRYPITGVVACRERPAITISRLDLVSNAVAVLVPELTTAQGNAGRAVKDADGTSFEESGQFLARRASGDIGKTIAVEVGDGERETEEVSGFRTVGGLRLRQTPEQAIGSPISHVDAPAQFEPARRADREIADAVTVDVARGKGISILRIEVQVSIGRRRTQELVVLRRQS